MNNSVSTDPTWLSAAQAARLIAERKLSATELVEALLTRTARREPQVSAWAFLDADLVRATARARDASPLLGPLHGVPVGIKDVIATSDQPTQYNSPIYTGNWPAADALCVERLRRAGAIIMGKTVTTEFAYVRPGSTSNPYDPSRTPGGSSSGSAAAVADGMVPVALGTQTGGSTIRPAAFCGVYGYKPGFGRWATQGCKHLAPSLDTLGLMTRDLEDISLLSAVLTAECVPERTTPPRLVLFVPSLLERAEPAAMALLEEVGRRCRARRIEAPAEMHELHSAHATIMAAEIARALEPEWRDTRDLLCPAMAATIERGRGLSEETIATAWSALARARRWLAREISGDEVLLTLPAAGEAPVGLQATGDASFNRVWTMLHASCLHVPVTLGRHRMPLGIQLVDVRGEEAALLAAAVGLVRELGLRSPRPAGNGA